MTSKFIVPPAEEVSTGKDAILFGWGLGLLMVSTKVEGMSKKSMRPDVRAGTQNGTLRALVLLLSFSFMGCVSKAPFSHFDYSIDYCSEQMKMEKMNNSTDSASNRETKAYADVRANCYIQRIAQHNQDSLTEDTCQCRKRLEAFFNADHDSVNVVVDWDTIDQTSIVTVSPKDPKNREGAYEYQIGDSCRLIGFCDYWKRKKHGGHNAK